MTLGKDSTKSTTRKGRPSKGSLHSVLTDHGWAEDRAQAERIIRAGLVRVNDELVDKPGTQVRSDARVEVLRKKHGFVSRGGLKLEAALEAFSFTVEGLRCLDVGIGTGGFTDCLLQRGASHVTGVDVGYGDVAWRLRQDPRVVLFERSNFRAMDVQSLNPPFDLVVVDCSFISLELLMANLALCVANEGFLLTLIKPQFEVGPGLVGKGGIVRDSALHAAVTARIATWLERQMGWQVLGIADSPVTGADGNREFLVAARRPAESAGA